MDTKPRENSVCDESHIIKDLINPGDTVVLVMHIDSAVPRGRIVLPHQQTIRDIIETGATAIVTQENNISETFGQLKEKPALVVSDSLFSYITASAIPPDWKITSLSVLVGRQKGDLEEFVHGLYKIKKLPQGSRLLIVEACQRQQNELGKAQIPNYVQTLTGRQMNYELASGNTFPRDPKDIVKYDGIIHCGGCILNQQEMKTRIKIAQDNDVPITNIGMLIAHAQGILDRILEPFPSALAAWKGE